MPAPTVDFLNGAVDAVVTALQQSVDFMASTAANPQPDGSPPVAGGTGVVMVVEGNLPDTTEIPQFNLPHAGVFYSRDEYDEGDSDAGATAIGIEVGIRIYSRGSDRQATWESLLQAAAAVRRVVGLEMNATGTQFDSFATNARYLGGEAIEIEEKSGWGAMQLVKVWLEATLSDY